MSTAWLDVAREFGWTDTDDGILPSVKGMAEEILELRKTNFYAATSGRADALKAEVLALKKERDDYAYRLETTDQHWSDTAIERDIAREERDNLIIKLGEAKEIILTLTNAARYVLDMSVMDPTVRGYKFVAVCEKALAVTESGRKKLGIT